MQVYFDLEPQPLHICVGKAWGLKTTLPQTPHSAGSLRHWVRPFKYTLTINLSHDILSICMKQILFKDI